MLLTFLPVRCLQCYTCNSRISMDDCSLNESKISCPAKLSSGFCGRMEVKDENKGTHIFSKGNLSLCLKHKCLKRYLLLRCNICEIVVLNLGLK